MNLTDTAVKNAKAADRPFKLFGDGERGLFLLIQPNGSKWWRFRYRINGKEKLLSLGVYPDVSLKVARKARDDARALVAEGLDPSALKQHKKAQRIAAAANSFESIAREWLSKMASTWVASHGGRVQSRLERDVFPYIGHRPIAEIKPSELLACVRKVEARGAIESAHRALTECGQVFRFAVASGYVESDPTRDLRGALQPVEKRHFPAITDAESAGVLMRAIAGYRGTPEVRAGLKLSALLFQRPGEIRHMQWNQIDLERAEWRYFVTKTKSNHVVPLPSQAIACLRELEPLTNRAITEKPDAPRYVFAGVRSRLKPMSENTIRQALRSLGYTNDQMTPHGFRAMARTLLAEMGWRPDAIERQLAHKVAGPLGAAYDRAQFLDERRKMMQAWADYLDGLADNRKVVAGKFGKVA